jgi:hypothetical protein
MRRVHLSRSLAALLIVALGLLFLQPGTASAAATLTVNPNTGPVGTVVTATGSGFGNGLAVRIYFNGSLVTTTTSSSTGTINTTFTVPAVVPGNYTVTAASSFAATSTQFSVVNAPAPAISLSPTSGPSGTVVTVSGSGFGASQTAIIYFNGVQVGTTTTTAAGTLPAGTTFTVPSIANGSYTVTVSTATRSASAPFTVATTTGAFTASKFVTVNGLGYSTTGNAVPGNTLTYQLQLTNNTGAALTGVVITDVIAPGQTVLAPPGFPCTFTSSNTLSCPVGTINNGSSASVFISTVVNTAFAGQIANQFTATATGGRTATSNTTVVYVSTGVPVTGSFLLCGPVTLYTPATASTSGSITISGLTIAIAAGSSATNIVLGTNQCILATVNTAGQLTALAGSLNLSGVSVACGIYTGSGVNTVNVGGVVVTVFPGTTFMAGLVVGASYCFILNASGQAIGAVLGIPTRAVLPAHHHPYWFDRVRTLDL